MQSNAVPLAVQDNRTKAVGADLVFGFQYLSAIGFDRGHRLVQSSLAVEIDERSVRRRLHFLSNKQATAHSILMRKGREFHPRHGLLLDFLAQNRVVKL